MTKLYCYIHPDVEASTKCEECGRLICLQCKKVYNRRYRNTYKTTEDLRKELCPECYYSLRDSDQRFFKTYLKFMIISMVIAVVIFVIMAIVMMNMWNAARQEQQESIEDFGDIIRFLLKF